MEQTALNENVHVRAFVPQSDTDVTQAIAEIDEEVRFNLQSRVNDLGGIKWWISIFVTFVRISPEGETQTTEAVFSSETYRLFNDDGISDDLANAYQQLFTNTEDFIALGSGWTIQKIDKIEVHSVIHQPLQPGTYIPTPKGLKGVVNVRNTDHKCIVWSILAFLFPAKRNIERISNYLKHENKLKVDGVRFPTPLNDVEKIENQNDLSIHIFSYEKESGIFPFRIAEIEKKNHVNLLLLSNFVTKHFVYIKSFHLLMGKEYRTRYCFNCLQSFSMQRYLDSHRQFCMKKRHKKLNFQDIMSTYSLTAISNNKNYLL